MAEVHIHLFGGEQDGYRTTVDLRGEVPGVFFIWRAADNDAISAASGRKRTVLADRLAVLAYRLAADGERTGTAGHRELRYERCPGSDKDPADPAL
jgi:hypothetical protein